MSETLDDVVINLEGKLDELDGVVYRLLGKVEVMERELRELMEEEAVRIDQSYGGTDGS